MQYEQFVEVNQHMNRTPDDYEPAAWFTLPRDGPAVVDLDNVYVLGFLSFLSWTLTLYILSPLTPDLQNTSRSSCCEQIMLQITSICSTLAL